MSNFKVWWPDRGHAEDDARTFTAADHEHAAELFADWHDSYHAEYCIVKGETACLMVKGPSDSEAVQVSVEGETSRQYTGYRNDES